MKTPTLTYLVLIAFALPLFGQDAQSDHEGYPVLKASEVLKPEALKGPHHTVLESIPSQGFSNQYTVDTQWGVITVYGNSMLLKRIHEFSAIAKLEEISKTGEFKDALVAAAAKPVKMAGGALKDPIGSVKAVGSGAGRFLKNVGESIDRMGKKSANSGSTVDGLTGFSKAKRQLAYELKVDPYSDNAMLQQRLDEVTRAAFAGGFIVKAGMMAIPGGAGMAVSTVNTSANLSASIRDNTPTGLSSINRKKLIELGVSEDGADDFVEHPAITPSQQTAITDQLSQLGRVGGNEDFLKMAIESKNVEDAAFFVQTAKMMAVYHKQVSPVKQILNLHGLPAIYAANNALVVPLSIDYGSWSEEADRLSQAIQNYNPSVEISQRLIYVSGIVSPRARKELEARGFDVFDRAANTVYR